MATVFNNVIVANFDENGQSVKGSETKTRVDMSRQGDSVVLCFYKGIMRSKVEFFTFSL